MFKNQKLDYPNATTDKASKKFLKGMKNLEVSLSSPHPIFLALPPWLTLLSPLPHPSFQQIIPPINVEQSRFCNLIKQLLHFDPARRLDVRGALSHEFFSLQM